VVAFCAKARLESSARCESGAPIIEFWGTRSTPHRHEIVFASTGSKNKNDPPWNHPLALAGSDIETNPPATNEAVAASGLVFLRTVDQLPPPDVLADIDAELNVRTIEDFLIRDGVAKFADRQKTLLKLLADRRRVLVDCGVY
jgi:transaldolase